MMKKTISILLCLAMIGTMLLAGCGNAEPSSQGTGGTSAASATGGDNAADDTNDANTDVGASEPYEVVMTYLYYGTLPADLQMIEDAISEISKKEINATVSFIPLTMSEYMTQVSLMLSSGEKLDLMLGFQQSGFMEFVNKNMAIPLDDLFAEYGAAMAEEQGESIAGGYLDGTLWGIPSMEKHARQWGIIADKAIVDKYGLDYSDIVSYEELDAFFEKVKAGEGENYYPLVMSGSTLTSYEYFCPVDYLGADAACGGILGAGKEGDSTILNVFAQEEYATHVKWMHEWYKKGYINTDAVTATETTQTYVQNDRGMGYLSFIELDMVPGNERGIGRALVGIPLTDKIAMTGTYQGQCWMIPVTCENPEAAFKFLNLLYENEEIINLLYWGIEGVHYVKTDDEGIITYPEGVDASNVTYSCALGLYGAVGKRYQQQPWTSEYFIQLEEFNATITEDNLSPYMGYAFNTESVKSEYAAVNDVLTQYRSSLESGSVDPEVMLPEFLSALEAAGINKIIEANQASLDEWLANQN